MVLTPIINGRNKNSGGAIAVAVSTKFNSELIMTWQHYFKNLSMYGQKFKWVMQHIYLLRYAFLKTMLIKKCTISF